MRILKIEENDIANGPGLRMSIFVAGCDVRCPGCFNTESWDFESGEEVDDSRLFEIFEKNPLYSGISILGGDPLAGRNISETLRFCKEFKNKFPDKNIWVWTGHLYENLLENDIFNENEYLIDFLVDGPFISKYASEGLKFIGSSNQRILKYNNLTKTREKV